MDFKHNKLVDFFKNLLHFKQHDKQNGEKKRGALHDSLKSAGEAIARVWRWLSPQWLCLPTPIIYFCSMFLFSFFIIAFETVQFHILLSVTNYLKANFIISIAFLGIAIGSFVGYYLNRIKVQVTLFFSTILLFLSIILSYYNLINIGDLQYPYLLILPFIFASIVISTIFAHTNSHVIYFTNLLASALGVLFPIIVFPLVKSEGAMMLLMLIPLFFVLIQTLRIKNVLIKAGAFVFVLLMLFRFGSFIKKNYDAPAVIAKDVFENKIMSELDPNPAKVDFTKNIPLEFFQRCYKFNKESNTMVFEGDAYDAKRARYLLQILGFVPRWGIGRIPLIEKGTVLKDITAIDKKIYDFEIVPALTRKFNTQFERNYDLLFLNRVYKQGDDGNYHLEGNAYDAKRARYLLTQLGHIETIDLNFDVRFHESLRLDQKLYTMSDRILLSEESIMGRVEYTGNSTMDNNDLVNAKDWYLMYVNGVALDSIDAYFGSTRDPRVPWMDDANMFIVGLSADGIVKSARRLKNAKVSGIEINPTILRTMNEDGPFSFAAGYAYRDVEVHEGEGRAYLENTDKKYDQIFLMNIHMEHGPLSTLSPEYFHTVEGTELLLNRLTERGYVTYEEIIFSRRDEFFMLKMINTIKEAMRRIGIEKPEENIMIYRWGFSPNSPVFRTIIIKRTAFDAKEKVTLNSYFDTIKTKQPYSAYDVSMVYSPYGPKTDTEPERYILNNIYEVEEIPARISASDFANRITAKIHDPAEITLVNQLYSLRGLTFSLNKAQLTEENRYRLLKIFDKVNYPYQIDLKPVYDDSPFPYNVYKNRHEAWELLRIVFLFSLILLVPVVLLLIEKIGRYQMPLSLPMLFVAISGFAYMLVEIVLIQYFQRFIGNPTLSLIVVLGGLLLFSGIGSFVSRYFSRLIKIISVALIPLMLFLLQRYLGNIFDFFAAASTNAKVAISLGLLLPITFLMGIPFPNAVEQVKKYTSGEYGILMFGISGAFSTIGSATAFVINVSHGYSLSFLVGIIAYAAALVLFVFILLFKRRSIA